RAAPQLFWPGRPPADAPQRGRAAFLSAGAILGPVSARAPGDGRRHHRVAGSDLGRVLLDAPGRTAGILPAAGHRAHLLTRNGTGLRAAGELVSDGHDDHD